MLAGCMRIYPDPELPDIEVTWYVDDCGEGSRVELALVGLDNGSRVEASAPCDGDGAKAVFADLTRQRYRIDADLFDADGQLVSTTLDEPDLRNGIDHDVELYFSTSSSYQVRWTFDMGASCASLAADSILIDLLPDPFLQSITSCAEGSYYGYAQNGTYTLRLYAISDFGTVVATSPESAPFTLFSPAPADLGLITLSPCGASCPEL